MERDRGFNFKLLVPPRVNTGQISTVRPQEFIENPSGFISTLQQDCSKYCEKEQNMAFHSTSLVAPTKPTRQDFPKMKAVSPMEKDKNDCNPGQLYSKLFDEVDKIKCWKVKVDSDTVQKERQLQENKRTIETQRKAIQELQFGNESLSIKLEEQITEIEDLRNKNSATRSLCNILKNTFERSTEKMHLFESEREETHHLFMENSESIQKLIAAFESLHIQAEADQKEMQKVKDDLLCFEELKKKYQQQCNMREEEVSGLQTSLKEKENELQEVIFDLCKTQKHCKQLQETTNQHYELLKSSKTEKESLFQKLQTAELHCKESDKSLEAITAALEKNKEECKEIIQSRDVSLQELDKVKRQQSEKLEQYKTTNEELQNSLSLKIQRINELEDKLMANISKAERTKTLLEEMMEQTARKDEQIIILEDKLIKVQEIEAKLLTETKINKEHTTQIEQLKNNITEHKFKYAELLSSFNLIQSEKLAIQQDFESGSSFLKVSEEKVVKLTREIQRLEEENQSLQDQLNSIESNINEKSQETETLQKKLKENCEHLQKEITEKEKQIKAVETKLCGLRKKLEVNLKAKEEYQKENKMLKKQMAKETAKSSQLESVIRGLHEDSQNMKRLNEEHHQKLLGDLESKSASVVDLENEVQKLRLTAADVIKNKEDTELKCQHKISDMVALMEKHKNQYDRMVEEKDTELQENKKKEVEIVARLKSLEVDLSQHKTENDNLKKQLKKETTEKENQQKELTDLKKECSSMKITPLKEAKNKQSHASNHKQGSCSETSKESPLKRNVFDASKTRKTPSYSKEDGGTAVLKEPMAIYREELKTPRSIPNQVGDSLKIKSYRIKTPPAAEKAACWWKSAIELDTKSDSSDQNDIFTFANAPPSNVSAARCQANTFNKIQSPATRKSPGNSLKLAAMKRMRDAGWTAVTGCDKKKKTSNEKIFA